MLVHCRLLLCSLASIPSHASPVLVAATGCARCRGHEVLTVVPRYSAYEGVEPTGLSVPLDLPLPPPAAVPQEPAAAEDAPLASAEQPASGPDVAAQQPDVDGAAASGSEQGEEQAGEGSSQDGAAASLPQHADLWLCQQGGVQRVFVDHPLFTSSGEAQLPGLQQSWVPAWQ